MKITNTDTVSMESSGHSSMSLSRSMILKLLRRMQEGSLVLIDEGIEQRFGEDYASTSLHARIEINDSRAYSMVLSNGSLGAGEAYMLGYWDSPDLLQVIRVFVANMALLDSIDSQGSWLKKLAARLFHKLRNNSLRGARENIAAHYDLSNELFSLFLDPTMAYSSAVFTDSNQSLEQASLNKFRRICEQLELTQDDHLLEIGTGWGGLAIYAASVYGCRVTTTTLSAEQAAYARAWVSREGLDAQVSVLEKDYRELQGSYSKLVSVEMIEAVGHQYYREYFQRCSALLANDGLMMIQAITISDQRYKDSLDNTDFIKRYIFPGGQLPSNSVICGHIASDTDMQLIDLHDITQDYAKTLCHWRSNFTQALPAVKKLGFDERFIRMWRYYLCFCEGGFLERAIHTAQFLMAKPGYRPDK